MEDGCQEAPESLEEGGIVPRQPGVDSFKELVGNSAESGRKTHKVSTESDD